MALDKAQTTKMRRAISEIAEELNSRQVVEHTQETNIFKILKLESHEIRHGAFLDFLMDPDRNVELAHIFVAQLVAQIVDQLGIEDQGFERVIDTDEYFDILKIAGENRFSEIPAGADGKQRIDQAIELKVGQTRRILVFEYKYNGHVQNDLVAYRQTIENKYKGTKSKIYYFLLDLGQKQHKEQEIEGFRFLNKDCLIDACRDTLEIACNKDMLLTRAYLQQYLEILDPEVTDDFLFTGLEKPLWNAWNPEIASLDDDAKTFFSLVDEYIEDESHHQALYDFEYHELFDRAVMSSLQRSGDFSCRLNQGWVRVSPVNCFFRDLYLWVSLFELDDTLFFGIGMECWTRKEMSAQEALAQKRFLLDVLQKSNIASALDLVDDLSRCKELWVNQDVQCIYQQMHRANSKRPNDFKVMFLREVSMKTLKQSCVAYHKPDEFEQMLADVQHFVGLMNNPALMTES